jgi:hypothetical protein
MRRAGPCPVPRPQAIEWSFEPEQTHVADQRAGEVCAAMVDEGWGTIDAGARLMNPCIS